MTTPREIHLREQRDALDQVTHFEWLARIQAGKTTVNDFDVFDEVDARFLEQLKAAAGEVGRSNCGHSEGQMSRVYWSPREPQRLRCAGCFSSRRDEPDTCDDCGLSPATSWREISLPPSNWEAGWPVGGPICIHLRLCPECWDRRPSTSPEIT